MYSRTYRLGIIGIESESFDQRASRSRITERVVDLLIAKEGNLEIVSSLLNTGVARQAYDLAFRFGLATAGFFYGDTKGLLQSTPQFPVDNKFIVGVNLFSVVKPFVEYCDELIIVNRTSFSDEVAYCAQDNNKRTLKIEVREHEPEQLNANV